MWPSTRVMRFEGSLSCKTLHLERDVQADPSFRKHLANEGRSSAARPPHQPIHFSQPSIFHLSILSCSFPTCFSSDTLLSVIPPHLSNPIMPISTTFLLGPNSSYFFNTPTHWAYHNLPPDITSLFTQTPLISVIEFALGTNGDRKSVC